MTELHENDKRRYHGALAKRSPHTIKPVRCIGPCGELIQSACLIVPGSLVCHRCWARGFRDEEESG